MTRSERHAYTAYGFTATAPSSQAVLGFNGEHLQAETSLYILGAGYRIYSPTLLRFYSADNLSPFSTGGLNTYAYCSGDPVNRVDPTGHSGLLVRMLKGIGNIFGRRPGKTLTTNWTYRETPDDPESLTYASVNSRSSLNSISSGYASVNSYTSISTARTPSLPYQPPPSSSGSDSRFSTKSAERLATRRDPKDIESWINEHIPEPDEQLRAFTLTPRAGAQFHRRYLNVQIADIRRMENYQSTRKGTTRKGTDLFFSN